MKLREESFNSVGVLGKTSMEEQLKRAAKFNASYTIYGYFLEQSGEDDEEHEVKFETPGYLEEELTIEVSNKLQEGFKKQVVANEIAT